MATGECWKGQAGHPLGATLLHCTALHCWNAHNLRPCTLAPWLDQSLPTAATRPILAPPLPPLRSTGAACTVWEAALEDLLPYLLENPGVLDALCCRAQRQREDLAATISWNRAAAEAAAGGTFGLDPPPPASGAPPAAAAGAADGGVPAAAPGHMTADSRAPSGAFLWTVPSSHVSADPGATQLPCAVPAATGDAGGGSTDAAVEHVGASTEAGAAGAAPAGASPPTTGGG